MEESLRKKLEFICEFCRAKPIIRYRCYSYKKCLKDLMIMKVMDNPNF